jgi:hypothetical protein
VVQEVAPQIQEEEEAEAQPEQQSDDLASEQLSESGEHMEQTVADEHGVSRRAVARPAARHWEQPDAAGPMASVRASVWRQTPAEAPSPWSLLHPLPLPLPSLKEALCRAEKPPLQDPPKESQRPIKR